jgi:hypothetical protein
MILKVVAFVFLLLGVGAVAWTLIPANPRIEVNPSLNLPDNMINYTTRNAGTLVPSRHDAEFTIILTAAAEGDVMAGQELFISITMTAPSTLAQHVVSIYVTLDNALIYPLQTDPSSGGPLFAYVNLYPSPDHYRWSGAQNIYYSQPGIFGATVIFTRNDTYTPWQSATDFPKTIGPIIQIESPDTVTSRHNEELTMGLSCLVIMFAALDLREKTTQHNSVRSNPKDSVLKKAASAPNMSEKSAKKQLPRHNTRRRSRSKNR